MLRKAPFSLIPTLLLSLVLTPLVATASPSPAPGDWPEWRGPKRDGISTESGWSTDWPKSGPKVLWTADVGVGFSACAVADGRVYTMGNIDDVDHVWCLDEATGKVEWKHTYPCKKGSYPGTRVTPTVDDGLVYTLSRYGDLFCLDARSGDVKWKTNIMKEHGVEQTKYDWGLSCSPLILGEKLIVDAGRTLAFHKKSGKPIWTSGSDKAGFSSPTTMEIGGRTYITSYTAFGLVLVDAENGKELARYRWKTSYEINSATPIPSGDKIFISSGYGKGCALLRVNGGELELVYENRDMRNHVNSCVLYEGHLYGFDGQQGSRGGLVCMKYDTGEVVWEEKGLRVGALMVADGKLVAMLDKGELLVAEASPKGYSQLARAQVLENRCWTYPVLANGRIYCRNNDRDVKLVCLDVSK